MNKYHNRRCAWNGIAFDSVAERDRYITLYALERAGEIGNLRPHPRYELQPGFVDNQGRRQRAIHYEADAEYVEAGRLVVEDTKGKATRDFLIKAKLFRFRYPEIELRIVGVEVA